MRAHWTRAGRGTGERWQGAYATTEKEFGDFELLVDTGPCRRPTPASTCGACHRCRFGTTPRKRSSTSAPTRDPAACGTTAPGAPGKDPLALADKPFGQWNALRILMVGSRVSVWLNGVKVVDHAIMENYYDRATPVPARGPIQLQTHGGEIRWRNIFIREIGAQEANAILESKGQEALSDIFNGRNFDGWAGPLDNYEVKDASIVCKPDKGGTIYWNQDAQRTSTRGSNSSCRLAATTAWPFATLARATPPMSV